MNIKLSQRAQRLIIILGLIIVSRELIVQPVPAAYADEFFMTGPYSVTLHRDPGQWGSPELRVVFPYAGQWAGLAFQLDQPAVVFRDSCGWAVGGCAGYPTAWGDWNFQYKDAGVTYCVYSNNVGSGGCDQFFPGWQSPNSYGLPVASFTDGYPVGQMVASAWGIGCLESQFGTCPLGQNDATITFYLIWYGTPYTPTPSETPTETLTPTPTVSPIPSGTPTRTPSDSTATRTHAPIRTPTPVRPPTHSSSSYIALWDSAKGKLDTAALEALGRTEAISETVKGVTDAIVVLHFGYPYRNGNGYGADLLVLSDDNLHFAPTKDVRDGAMAFVKAFCENSSSTMHLSLALGVNDSVQGIGSGHGQAWARMIDEVSEAIQNNPPLCRPFIGAPPRMSVVGAMDIEPSSLITQSIPIDVIRWAEAYSNTTRSRYYNFGTCSNCPAVPPEQPHNLPSTSPLMDDVWTVSWGIPNAYPLPQIYNTNKLNANQWYNLKLYAVTCTSPCRPAQRPMYFRPMSFPGTMTQWQSCNRKPKPDTCIQADNSPEEGWRQLFDALNANPITRQVSLRWSTDIVWRVSKPQLGGSSNEFLSNLP